jgi:hypothetical protein
LDPPLFTDLMDEQFKTPNKPGKLKDSKNVT